MTIPHSQLSPDRLFPIDPQHRALSRNLYEEIKGLPIISPHGHTDPAWFALDQPFANPAALLITPDHYLLRLLYSQGLALESFGREPLDNQPFEQRGRQSRHECDPRTIWRLFAKHFYLFRGTPSALWMAQVLSEVFSVPEGLNADSADQIYDQVHAALGRPDFRPRSLFKKFNIEVLCTTDGPTDPLQHHQQIRQSGWPARIIPCFRPDPVLDPEHEHFQQELNRLSELTGEDTLSFAGYLLALRNRRDFFRSLGATSTDHGHPTAATLEATPLDAEKLFHRAISGTASPSEAEKFRAMMLFEMARMSLDDGLVMQLHPGACRNHNQFLYQRFGRDVGGDIPTPTEYVRALKPMLDRFGNEKNFRLILFTLDESVYARELAPLAGLYPAVKLGPPWWFHDSPEGMKRFREQVTETAGIYNTVGFNDDTRAFCSIPARHDMARRMDCVMLAKWVLEHRLREDEALEMAHDLTYRLAKESYRL
ncbi:MAG: glucuronate isomerase [Bdellovibrio sp.]|nr:MAG: glucuronate isomerase [Bdellovibrio sp.]